MNKILNISKSGQRHASTSRSHAIKRMKNRSMPKVKDSEASVRIPKKHSEAEI